MGPNPADRGKGGIKRHLITDRRGIPLAVRLTGANRHESTVFEELLDAIPPIKRSSGQRCRRPDKLHADKTYDVPRCRRALSRRRIKVRIARKGIEPKERLVRHRWKVERTVASTAAFNVIVMSSMTGISAYNAATARAASGADSPLS